MADEPQDIRGRVAATDPAVRERIERAEIYSDPAVENDFHADIILMEDRDGNGEWHVDYQDDEGGCYVTIFAGPQAEPRVRDYFEALNADGIRTVRAGTEHLAWA